jgi:hypothetical protein
MWSLSCLTLYVALVPTVAAFFFDTDPAYVSSVQSDSSNVFTCSTPQSFLEQAGTPNIVMTDAKRGFFENFFYANRVSYVLYFGSTGVPVIGVPPININPIVSVFDVETGNQVWCEDQFESTLDTGRAIGALYIPTEDALYLAFSIDGSNGAESDDFRRFTQKGWIPSYGINDGPDVAVILPVDRYSGAVLGEGGTYLRSIDSNGNTNSFAIQKLSWDQLECRSAAPFVVRVQAEAADFPPARDGVATLTASDCLPDTESPYSYTITLTRQLNASATVACRALPDVQCCWWQYYLF